MAKCKFLTRETSEQVGAEWCNLPDDVLSIILSHLFGKDYIHLFAVCSLWTSAAPPLRPIPNPYLMSDTSEASDRYPSLFHFSGNSSKCKYYDPFYNGSYVAQIPDELIDARIYFSNHGWLLMSQASQLFFFHPFTFQRIDLPAVERLFTDEYSRMCFSSPPTSPDCMVFGIVDIFPSDSDISIIRRGEVSWTDFSYKPKNVSFDSSHSNPVFYRDAFYCLSIDGKLGVFDPNKRRCRCWKIIDKLKHPCESIQENFLVESNGELLSICMGSIGEYVRIFRLNYDYGIRWEEVYGLGDEMIFASRTGCISMQTHTMGNTIYFPAFDNEGNGMFYSLASRKFHTLWLGLAKKDLYNSRRLLHCAWVTPTASDIYTEDELRWFPDGENFIPSRGRVMVEEGPRIRPLFVFTSLKYNRQLVFNMFDSPHNTERIAESRLVLSNTCAFGWLFQIYEDNADCFLFNPETMEKIHLPRQPEMLINCSAISSSPNDPNCIVLLIHHSYNNEENIIKFIYCRPGESEWTTVTVGKKHEELWILPNELENSIDSDSDEGEEEEEEDKKTLLRGMIMNIIGCHGKIYGIVRSLRPKGIDFRLLKIDFDPVFKIKFARDKLMLPLPSTLGTIFSKTYMAESCDEVFVVRVNFYGKEMVHASEVSDVEVFKLDDRRKIWEKVGGLCDNIALFCYDGMRCISSSSMEKGKGNRIYFIACFSDHENIYAFDFEDGSFSVSLAFPDVNMDCFTWTSLLLT